MEIWLFLFMVSATSSIFLATRAAWLIGSMVEELQNKVSELESKEK